MKRMIAMVLALCLALACLGAAAEGGGGLLGMVDVFPHHRGAGQQYFPLFTTGQLFVAVGARTNDFTGGVPADTVGGDIEVFADGVVVGAGGF